MSWSFEDNNDVSKLNWNLLEHTSTYVYEREREREREREKTTETLLV